MLTNIYISLRKFFDVNRVGATNVYFGRETWRRIQADKDAQGNIQMFAEKRTTFLGLDVYIVDADNHFALS
jgi:hypothetical protein